MKICYQCSGAHRKCDKMKPVCGRCSRLGKPCTYKEIRIVEDHQHDELSSTAISTDNIYQHGRLRIKQNGKIMTVDEAVRRIQMEYNIPKSSSSIKSILLSSPKNRIVIFEFIKGYQFKRKPNDTIDKIYFYIYKFKKKDIHEIMW